MNVIKYFIILFSLLLTAFGLLAEPDPKLVKEYKELIARLNDEGYLVFDGDESSRGEEEDNLLKPGHFEAFMEALKSDKTVFYFYIDEVKLGDVEAQLLAKMLEHNDYLTTIVLNQTDIGQEGANALLNSLKKNVTLTGLHGLEDTGVNFNQELDKNIRLQKLTKSDIWPVVKILFEGIHDPKSNISEQRIGKDVMSHIFDAIMQLEKEKIKEEF